MFLFSLQNSTHQPHSSETEDIFSMNFKNSGIEIFFSNGKLTSKMKIFFQIQKPRHSMYFLRVHIYFGGWLFLTKTKTWLQPVVVKVIDLLYTWLIKD